MTVGARSFDEAEAELSDRITRYGGWFQRFQFAHKIEILRRSGCLSLLSPNGTVLDLGCGTGIVACMVALTFPQKQVIGIDTDKRRIGSCQKLSNGIPNVSFLSGDIRSFNLHGSKEIICFDVLHHLPEQAQDRLILSVAANLDLGGRLIVFEVDITPSPRWKYWVSLLSDYILYPFQEKAHFRSSLAYQDLFRSAGLEVEMTQALPSSIVAPILYVARRAAK